MSFQLYSIKGNTAELLFNPQETDIQVGQNLIIEEKISNRGLVVQIFEMDSFNYPSRTEEQVREMMEKSYKPEGGTTHIYEESGATYPFPKIAKFPSVVGPVNEIDLIFNFSNSLTLDLI